MRSNYVLASFFRFVSNYLVKYNFHIFVFYTRSLKVVWVVLLVSKYLTLLTKTLLWEIGYIMELFLIQYERIDTSIKIFLSFVAYRKWIMFQSSFVVKSATYWSTYISWHWMVDLLFDFESNNLKTLIRETQKMKWDTFWKYAEYVQSKFLITRSFTSNLDVPI